MRIIFIVLLSLVYFSCSGPSGGGSSAKIEGFQGEAISGSSAEYHYKGSKDKPSESGYSVGGKRNGTWLTYHENGRIETLTTYVDGQKNGPYLELSDRGQIEAKTEYQADKLHGLKSTYKFGKPQKTTPYKNGEIDGTYVEFNKDGDPQKEINFKNGKQHGSLKYYDENGKVTLEYEYKNGEKISGGIPEK